MTSPSELETTVTLDTATADMSDAEKVRFASTMFANLLSQMFGERIGCWSTLVTLPAEGFKLVPGEMVETSMHEYSNYPDANTAVTILGSALANHTSKLDPNRPIN